MCYKDRLVGGGHTQESRNIPSVPQNHTLWAHAGFRTFSLTSNDAQEENGWYLILLCMYLSPKAVRAKKITMAFHLGLLTIKALTSAFREQV